MDRQEDNLCVQETAPSNVTETENLQENASEDVYPLTLLQETSVPSEYTAVGDATLSFPQFCDTHGLAHVAAIVKALISEVEKGLKLESYHFKIANNFNHRAKCSEPGFMFHVYASTDGDGDDDENKGPVNASKCMSCELDCPLVQGVLGSNAPALPIPSPLAEDSLISTTEHCRVWLDAKARPMFVITPKEHLQRISQLSDDELVDMLTAALERLKFYNLFNSMQSIVVNHGDFRNHAHLHFKLRVQMRHFYDSVWSWPVEDKTKLERLQQFSKLLPRQKAPIYKRHNATANPSVPHNRPCIPPPPPRPSAP